SGRSLIVGGETGDESRPGTAQERPTGRPCRDYAVIGRTLLGKGPDPSATASPISGAGAGVDAQLHQLAFLPVRDSSGAGLPVPAAPAPGRPLDQEETSVVATGTAVPAARRCG